MVVMLYQDCSNGRRLRRVTCGCHVAAVGGGSGGRPVVVMLHQDCINGRRLRRVTCGCHVAAVGGGSGG